MSTATRVILAGALGEKYGREFNLHIETKREFFSIMQANFPDFIDFLRDLVKQGMNFVVQHNGQAISEDEMKMRAGGVLTITPTLEGAGGALQIIVGAAMIAIAVWNPMVGGAMLMSSTTAMAVGMTGAMLLLGGVTSYLSPQPKLGDLGREDAEGAKSYYFNAAEQAAEQGAAVTVIYGENQVDVAQVLNARINIR